MDRTVRFPSPASLFRRSVAEAKAGEGYLCSPRFHGGHEWGEGFIASDLSRYQNHQPGQASVHASSIHSLYPLLKASMLVRSTSMTERLRPVTPGELLEEDFLLPLRVSQSRLSREIKVPRQRISDIVAGRQSMTTGVDSRLCRFFGLSEGYWLRAQQEHDAEAERGIQ